MKPQPIRRRCLFTCRQRMCPLEVWVAWEDGYGEHLFFGSHPIPRNIRGRRIISHLIGTDSWEWVGENKIRARLKTPDKETKATEE